MRQIAMDGSLKVREAAQRLGIAPATLYDWLGQSDHGVLQLQGERVTIRYYQGGPQGQGRIQIEADEVERIRECMRVHPIPAAARRSPAQQNTLPGITAKLGLPPV
jgi:transposase-like protein